MYVKYNKSVISALDDQSILRKMYLQFEKILRHSPYPKMG